MSRATVHESLPPGRGRTSGSVILLFIIFIPSSFAISNIFPKHPTILPQLPF